MNVPIAMECKTVGAKRACASTVSLTAALKSLPPALGSGIPPPPDSLGNSFPTALPTGALMAQEACAVYRSPKLPPAFTKKRQETQFDSDLF